jgi:WD40 repeat protein
MVMTAGPGARVAGYLGRVLDQAGDPVGTCFQVVPGILVTAWHVLNDIATAAKGMRVDVDPLAGGDSFAATVAGLDEVHDLAVLVSDTHLGESAGALVATDTVPLRAKVMVTGHVYLNDPGYRYRSFDAPGRWAGAVVRDDESQGVPRVLLGRMTAEAISRGMSGAPVVYERGGFVAGVVTGRYNSADGWLAGTAWVSRTEDLRHLLGDLVEIDLRVTPAGYAAAGSYQARPLPSFQADYLPTVQEIQLRTGNLEDRGEELAKLAEFSCGAEGYKLIVGEQYAGKTALLAEFVASHLPPQVDVVAYFASRSLSDADSNKFLAEVVPQLAGLIGMSPSEAVPTAFRALWQEAARRAVREDRHLLLVVDGLDEDYAPAGLPTIGALLPVTVAPTARAGHGRGGPGSPPKEWSRAHVLVSNRLEAPLPAGLPPEHPLHAVTPMELPPYPHSRPNDEEELRILLSFGPEARRLIGALAAAGGALSVADLHELTQLPRERLEELISQTLRSLRRVGPAGARRYAFASISMLERARQESGLDLSRYRDAIHRWAADWRDRGWRRDQRTGVDVPHYLLDSYPDALAHDRARLAALVSDVGWVTAAIDRIAVDLVLAELRTCVAADRDHRTPHAMLAVVRSQAPYLRSLPVLAPGQAARQLCLQAAELDHQDLAAAFRDRLAAYPGLVPMWTSRRQHPALAAEINGQAGWVNAVVLAPDGSVVAGTDDGRIWNWDASTSVSSPVTLGRHDGPVRALAILPDGRVVSGGHDGRVRLWDLTQPGQDPVELGQHDGAVRALAFHQSGKVISGGDDARVRAWNPDEPWAAPVELGRHAGAVRGLATDPAGRIISGGDDQRARIWDLNRPEVILAQTGRLGWRVMAVSAASDRLVMLAGTDFGLYRWRHMLGDAADAGSGPPPSGPMVAGVGGHHNVVRAISTTGEGMVISSGDDGRILLWQDSGYRGIDRIELGRHEGSVRALTALIDDQMASGGKDQRVRLWDLRGRAFALAGSRIRPRPANSVSICPDGQIVTGGADGRVWRWNAARPAEPLELGRHDSAISAVVALSSGRVTCCDTNGDLRLWTPAEPSQCIGLGKHQGAVLAAFENDLVVSGGYDGQVRLWDPTGRSDPVLLGGHDGPVVALALLSDGRVISGETTGDVTMWERGRAGERPDFERYEGRLNALAVLSGHLFGGGDDGNICIWDLTGRKIGTVAAHGRSWVTSLAALPTGHLISAGTDDRIILWQFVGEELRNISSVASSVRVLTARRTAEGRQSVAVAHADSGISCWALRIPAQHADSSGYAEWT